MMTSVMAMSAAVIAEVGRHVGHGKHCDYATGDAFNQFW